MTWTDKELRFVNEHYGMMTVREMAEMIGKSPKSVEYYAGKMGLRRDALAKRLMAAEVEIAKLRAALNMTGRCETCRVV
jgi:hypothetical protein